MYGFRDERQDKSVRFANGKVYINNRRILELCKRETY